MASERLKALIIDDINPVAAEILGKYMDVTVDKRPLKTEELASVIEPYHLLMMRVSAKIGPSVIDKAPNLKIVASATAGLDHVDLGYCREKGITVINAAGGNAESVAELAFGFMISLFREIPRASKDVKSGVWNRAAYNGRELLGKTLGLVAVGNVGRRVAELSRAFGMSVLAFDPYVSQEAAREMGVKLVSLEEVLRESDVVSIHAPLTPETRHMISAPQIAMMKDGAYLVNAGRGGIVDEAAAYEALKSGKLAGMAADVMEVEPCLQSPLYELDNFIVTPHFGGQTPEALKRMASIAAERALEALGLKHK